jgi:hypothetical protein
MKCELEAGVKLRNWLANDVLPSIRQTGSFSFSQINVTAAELINNSKREVQIQNSKDINTFNYEKGGVKEVIRYNVENCKQVTGETPAVVIKRYGRPCKNSAKEALRKTDPAKAMTMSMNDYLVIKHEAKIEMLGKLDEHLIKTFEEMIKLGFNLVIE